MPLPIPRVALRPLSLVSLCLSCSLLQATSAAAQCAVNEEVLLACPIGEKRLTVCATQGASILYSFATTRQVELRLHRGPEAFDYRPWPGIGATIWESVTFGNGGFAYEVYTSFDKNERQGAAGVRVTRGDAEIAHLRCDEGGEAFGFDPIYYALQEEGFCALSEGVVVKGGCQ